jgi:hypothetical protein
VNNAERAAIAEAVLGMEVNRLNLAWLVVDRARSAYEESLHAAGGIEAFGVDALEETLRGHADGSRAEKIVLRGNETTVDANVPLPRARYVAAASAMLDLHWMRERVVSNEFHRDRLAVLRGGAKIQGDAWPDATDAKLAVAHSVPKWFAARLIEERGVEGASALAAALSTEGASDGAPERAQVRLERDADAGVGGGGRPGEDIFGLERNSFARRARRAFVRLRAPALGHLRARDLPSRFFRGPGRGVAVYRLRGDARAREYDARSSR